MNNESDHSTACQIAGNPLLESTSKPRDRHHLLVLIHDIDFFLRFAFLIGPKLVLSCFFFFRFLIIFRSLFPFYCSIDIGPVIILFVFLAVLVSRGRIGKERERERQLRDVLLSNGTNIRGYTTMKHASFLVIYWEFTTLAWLWTYLAIHTHLLTYSVLALVYFDFGGASDISGLLR